MITQRVKRVIAEDVNPQLKALAADIRGLKIELDGSTPINGAGFIFFQTGVKGRVKNLEQKVDLLLKYLNLYKTDVPAKTVLKKCKPTKTKTLVIGCEALPRRAAILRRRTPVQRRPGRDAPPRGA